MLLEVDLSSILSQALANERTAINDAFRRADDRPRTEFVRVDDGNILVRLRTKEDADKALPLIQGLSQPIDPSQINSSKTTRVVRESDKNIRVTITDENIEYIRKQTIEKSIGVLGRRIDPNGIWNSSSRLKVISVSSCKFRARRTLMKLKTVSINLRTYLSIS